MGAAQGTNPRDFLRARRFKKNVAGRKPAAVRIEEPLRLHPGDGGQAQIDWLSIEIGELRFVTHDYGLGAALETMAKKFFAALKRDGVLHPRPVDNRLEPGPLAFPLGQEPDRIADPFLAFRRSRFDQPFFQCDGVEELVVTDQCVIEIDPDQPPGRAPAAVIHPSARPSRIGSARRGPTRRDRSCRKECKN